MMYVEYIYMLLYHYDCIKSMSIVPVSTSREELNRAFVEGTHVVYNKNDIYKFILTLAKLYYSHITFNN